MLTGFAAVTVVGVAALYHKQNRQVVTDVPHPLEGSLAKRMERFHTLAGKASPGARTGHGGEGGGNLDTDSGTVYVHMESDSAGANTMAMV
jgi:hypothetical protein